MSSCGASFHSFLHKISAVAAYYVTLEHAGTELINAPPMCRYDIYAVHKLIS